MPLPFTTDAVKWLVSIFLLVVVGFVLFWRSGGRDDRFDTEIQRAASRYGLDPALVKSVVWRESAFNPAARGGVGELGLMQLQEVTAQEWADAEKINQFRPEHLLDVQTNLFAGCFYLAKVSKRYRATDNPFAYGLADYNAGRTHVLRWKKGEAATNSAAFLAQMDYPGTRKYIHEILGRAPRYRRDFR